MPTPFALAQNIARDLDVTSAAQVNTALDRFSCRDHRGTILGCWLRGLISRNHLHHEVLRMLIGVAGLRCGAPGGCNAAVGGRVGVLYAPSAVSSAFDNGTPATGTGAAAGPTSKGTDTAS